MWAGQSAASARSPSTAAFSPTILSRIRAALERDPTDEGIGPRDVKAFLINPRMKITTEAARMATTYLAERLVREDFTEEVAPFALCE